MDTDSSGEFSGAKPDPAPKELSGESVVPYRYWSGRGPRLRAKFSAGRPTRHLVLDDFLAEDAARQALDSFPPLGDGWIHYLHYNERTYGMNDRGVLPAASRRIIDELSTDRFLALLGEITGVEALCFDDSLEGGGLHQSERGGYLNLHADFTVHPRKPRWRRALNLLIYLNPDWDESWGGQLELWDADVRECVEQISPVFNRAVVFETHEHSYHGYPDPMTCPDAVSRKAFAVYYFTAEAVAQRPISTRYRGRPGDSAVHRLLISSDAFALRLYDRAKRKFGFDDTLATRILRAISGRR